MSNPLQTYYKNKETKFQNNISIDKESMPERHAHKIEQSCHLLC